MDYGREQILPDYGYRDHNVKHNLEIEVDNPTIDWGIYNFVVSTCSETAFPSAVVGQLVWLETSHTLGFAYVSHKMHNILLQLV